jgi:hypothetical protein
VMTTLTNSQMDDLYADALQQGLYTKVSGPNCLGQAISAKPEQLTIEFPLSVSGAETFERDANGNWDEILPIRGNLITN